MRQALSEIVSLVRLALEIRHILRPTKEGITSIKSALVMSKFFLRATFCLFVCRWRGTNAVVSGIVIPNHVNGII